MVTGAADGIGYALCRTFAQAGMRIVMADIDGARVGEAAARLGAETGAEVLPVPTDVADWAQVQDLRRRAVERFGPVHVLCNNAGVSLVAPAWEIPLEEFDWMLRVNLWGVLHGIKAFAPGMIEAGEPGHIVNTASIGGLLGFPYIGAYSCSKFAIVGLSESLYLDLRAARAPIGVSVLCPGATATNLAQNTAALRPNGNRAAVEDPPDAAKATAAEVAAQVRTAIEADRFWVLTHPGYEEALRSHHRSIETGEDNPRRAGFFL